MIDNTGGTQSHMAYYVKSIILSLSLAGIILLAGCSGSPSNPTTPAVEAPAQAADQPDAATSSQPLSGQNTASVTGTSDNITPVAVQPQALLPNRVDVIYFHVNQRCPTCLCFEERVNHIIEADFNDEISSGRLTYKVLNAQQVQNAEIARKYGAVGSQLFINTVVNGEDHIKDIQDIWNWNCRYNAPNFDRNVRSSIESSLKGLK
jgi:hypothetical protein